MKLQAVSRRWASRRDGRMSDARLLRAFARSWPRPASGRVVCPGSRSTPLALALAGRRPASGSGCCWTSARPASSRSAWPARAAVPSSCSCTSGTATVEFAPAVVEARYSRVPLVVLTADRPPELRDRGAPQTIDQDHLYGRAAKWYTELPLFDGDPATEAHVRSVAGRAVATAWAAPAGPVQLNVPFREPLLPDGPLDHGDAGSTASTGRAHDGGDKLDGARSIHAAIDDLAGRIGGVGAGG